MLTDHDFFLLPQQEGLLDYQEVFGNANPVFVEIGSGKGEFISQYPVQNPQYNFLGFEVRAKRIRNILKKIEPLRHPNVRLLEEYVDHRITERLPAASIQGVFIQHPDPWPKKRHFKRRLFQPEFLRALAAILIPGGFVQVSTDHAEYAGWIAKMFADCPLYECENSDAIQSTPHLSHHVVTWFEQEQRRLGFEPHFMLYKKI